MILPDGRTIKIGDVEFPNVKWRTRVVFEYETLTGEDYFKIGAKLESQFKLFYCAAKVGSKIAGVEFKYTYDQFLELTNDYFNETIIEFTAALYEKKEGVKKK